MAIWQFRVDLVPRESILDAQGELRVAIKNSDWESINWWSNFQPPLFFIDEILDETQSWSDEMRIWGNKSGNEISVIFVDKNKESVEWISVCIDLRGSYIQFVSNLVELAKKMDCVFIANNRECVQPDTSLILQALRKSTAYHYIHDPKGALKNTLLKKEEEMDEESGGG